MKNDSELIRVMILKAGVDEGRIVEKFPNTLEALQKAVGGYIEAVRVNDSIVIWCNEHGQMMGLNHNFHLYYNGGNRGSVAGDVVIVATEYGDNVSLTDEEIDEIQKRFLNRDTFDLSKKII